MSRFKNVVFAVFATLFANVALAYDNAGKDACGDDVSHACAAKSLSRSLIGMLFRPASRQELSEYQFFTSISNYLTIAEPYVFPASITVPPSRKVLKIVRSAAVETAGVSQIYREHAMRSIYLPRYIYIDSNNCWVAKGEAVEKSEIVEKSGSVELYSTYPVVAKGSI